MTPKHYTDDETRLIGNLTGQFYVKFTLRTVTFMVRIEPEGIIITSMDNKNPGNGYFKVLLRWFEEKTNNERMVLKIERIVNERLYNHLVKRGYKIIDDETLQFVENQNIKSKDKKYTKKLSKNP